MASGNGDNLALPYTDRGYFMEDDSIPLTVKAEFNCLSGRVCSLQVNVRSTIEAIKLQVSKTLLKQRAEPESMSFIPCDSEAMILSFNGNIMFEPHVLMGYLPIDDILPKEMTIDLTCRPPIMTTIRRALRFAGWTWKFFLNKEDPYTHKPWLFVPGPITSTREEDQSWVNQGILPECMKTAYVFGCHSGLERHRAGFRHAVSIRIQEEFGSWVPEQDQLRMEHFDVNMLMYIVKCDPDPAIFEVMPDIQKANPGIAAEAVSRHASNIQFVPDTLKAYRALVALACRQCTDNIRFASAAFRNNPAEVAEVMDMVREWHQLRTWEGYWHCARRAGIPMATGR